MRFSIPTDVPIQREQPVEIGNVYASKNTTTTVAWVVYDWVVIGLSATGCHMVGINSEGEVTTTQSYNTSVMERRKLIGKCMIPSDILAIHPLETSLRISEA